MREYEARVGGYVIGMDADGILTVEGTAWPRGEQAEREACAAYPHLALAQHRRAAASARVARERDAAILADRQARQAQADERLARCPGHRAIAKEHRTVAWTHCVADQCSGASHGGVTHIDRCRCGAVRATESNGCRSRTSGWYLPIE